MTLRLDKLDLISLEDVQSAFDELRHRVAATSPSSSRSRFLEKVE
jgi:hypothetical protein